MVTHDIHGDNCIIWESNEASFVRPIDRKHRSYCVRLLPHTRNGDFSARQLSRLHCHRVVTQPTEQSNELLCRISRHKRHCICRIPGPDPNFKEVKRQQILLRCVHMLDASFIRPNSYACDYNHPIRCRCRSVLLHQATVRLSRQNDEKARENNRRCGLVLRLCCRVAIHSEMGQPCKITCHLTTLHDQ